MKCQILFSRENKKDITTWSSAESAHSVISVKQEFEAEICGLLKIIPVSILYKSTAGRYRPVSYPDGPITVRYRFIKNASWDVIEKTVVSLYMLIFEYAWKSVWS